MQNYKVTQCSAPGEAVPQIRTEVSCCRFVEAVYSASQRKDIHRYSWTSNDGHTQKEIDHVCQDFLAHPVF